MAYTPTPPTMDPSQKMRPMTPGINDTPQYVGKPKPQAPRPGMGYSQGGGSFDPSSLRRPPRLTQVLPGQGMGPMPVGTKPLPMPSVRDARGDLGMIRDASMNQYPGVPNWGGRGDTHVYRPPGWDGNGVDTGFGGGMMKPPAMPGGETGAPGAGMPTQYGGGPSGRGGTNDVYDGVTGAVQRGPMSPGAPSGGRPPQGQGGGRQPLRPGMEYRPGGGQRPQAPQMQMPPGMNPDAWNQMDEETRMRLAGMWGRAADQYNNGGMQPILPNEQGQAQMPNLGGWDPRMGSGYYGAF